MSINWIFHVHGGSFFRDMDNLVRDLLTKRLEKIAPRGRHRDLDPDLHHTVLIPVLVWTILERKASELAGRSHTKEPIEILPYVQASMAEATVTIFLGQVSLR